MLGYFAKETAQKTDSAAKVLLIELTRLPV
jgi:hypothetical protein